MSDYVLNMRRLFRHRLERYLIDRSITSAADVDGSRLTLVELCDILAQDREPVPPYLEKLLERRFAREWADNLPSPLTYGGLASATWRHLGRQSIMRSM